LLKISFLVLLAAATTCFAGTPEAAFESLVDAIYAGDAQEFSTFLSAESAGMVSMILMMLKADPEQAAADISAELGVEVTAEEISGWSSADLLAMVLSAPGFIAEFPPRESIHVSGSTVNGDSCLVSFTVDGIEGNMDLPMVMQNGSWKLDQSVIQAEL